MRWIDDLYLLFEDIKLLQNFQKISAQFSAILRFQAAARDTGFRWIDGKVVYEKLVTIAALPDTTTGTTAHGISSFSNILLIQVIANNSTDFICLSGESISLDGTNINVTTTFDASGYSGYCRIQYTI